MTVLPDNGKQSRLSCRNRSSKQGFTTWKGKKALEKVFEMAGLEARGREREKKKKRGEKAFLISLSSSCEALIESNTPPKRKY